MFCHLHITMNSASTKQSHPSSHLWFVGHCQYHILCLLSMVSTAKKVNHAVVMFQFCMIPVVSDHWSIQVHGFIHQTCMATGWQKTNKSDIIWVYTFFTHLFKMFKSFPNMPMHSTSSQYGIPSHHISRCHVLEHCPSILNAPTFCIHINQTIPHKDIWLQTNLNDLVMNTPDLFKHNHAGTCIQHPHKSNRVWLHTFLLHLPKEFQCPLPLPASHMS